MAHPSSATRSSAVPALPDRLTLVAISALAWLVETALHEHLGHAGACLALGSRPTELGAFYIGCDNATLSDLSIRLVSLAGPVASLLTGVVSFLVLRRLSPGRPALYFFVWLLGTIGFMTATGYLFFSGVSGVGDFGTTRDGVFYGASPAWLWRTLLTVAGAVSYYAIARFAAREIAPHVEGVGRARITYARHLVLVTYVTGAVVTLAIGLLHPQGLFVSLTSAAAALGGASGFLWMMQFINPDEQASRSLAFGRRWGWIALGAVVTVAYALVLGPTLYF